MYSEVKFLKSSIFHWEFCAILINLLIGIKFDGKNSGGKRRINTFKICDTWENIFFNLLGQFVNAAKQWEVGISAAVPN